MPNLIIIPYSELTGQRLDDRALDEISVNFERNSTFHFLTTINNYLSISHHDLSKNNFNEVQRMLCHHLLSEEFYGKVAAITENFTRTDRVVFHRWQILFLMKIVLLESKVDGVSIPRNQSNVEDRYLLGKACLIANDLYISEEQEEQVKTHNITDGVELDRVSAEFLAQMVSRTELDNPPDLGDATARIDRFIEILDGNFPQSFNSKTLSAYVEDLIGMDLKTFVEMVLAIQAQYISTDFKEFIKDSSKFNINPNIWFSTTDFSDAQIKAFFGVTTTTIDYFVSALQTYRDTGVATNNDFRAFRIFPLVHLTDDSITCIDNGLLLEKFTLGIYHTILNAIPAESSYRRTFMDLWGGAVEIYMHEIMHMVYPPSQFSNYYPNTFFDTDSEQEAFDGIVECPNALIVMECKGGSLKSDAKYSGSKDLFLEDLDRKFGRVKGAGVEQLTRKINSLFGVEKRLRIRDLDFQFKKFVYPVMVVSESCLEFSLAKWRLRRWFEDAMDLKSIIADVYVKPLTVLTISDLESLTYYLADGDFAFVDFLEFYVEALNKEWFHPMMRPENLTISGSFVFSKFREANGIEFRPNDFILSRSGAVFDRVKSRLAQMDEMEIERPLDEIH
jgi:hypothetical protein